MDSASRRVITMPKKLFILLLLGVFISASAANHAAAFRLRSSTFEEGTAWPDRTVLNGLDCHGRNVSPALEWSGAPAATKSFALVLDDFEARGGDGFIHWGIYNLPATLTHLAENAPTARPD